MTWLWILVICGLLGTIINFLLFLTSMKAVFKVIDQFEDLEAAIELLNKRKIDRPQPPPDIVPLERM